MELSFSLRGERLKKLPLSLNIIGVCFYLKITRTSQLQIDCVTASELANLLIGTGIISSSDIQQTRILITHKLQKLARNGLVIKLTAEEAIREGSSSLPENVKYVYTTTPAGEELLRYVYPYQELFPDEMLLPENFFDANRTLRTLLGRKKLFSAVNLRKITLTRKFGKTEVVLKRIPQEEAVKLFPQFPIIGLDELVAYFRERKISLEDELIAVLEKAFLQEDKVRFEIISNFLKNHREEGHGKVL